MCQLLAKMWTLTIQELPNPLNKRLQMKNSPFFLMTSFVHVPLAFTKDYHGHDYLQSTFQGLETFWDLGCCLLYFCLWLLIKVHQVPKKRKTLKYRLVQWFYALISYLSWDRIYGTSIYLFRISINLYVSWSVTYKDNTGIYQLSLYLDDQLNV